MSTAAPALQDVRLAESSGTVQEARFQEIYHQYQRKVYATCRRMLSNQEEAEDVTQDVFLQVFRKLHTFRGEATLSTWLHRVTINAVLMHIRRNKKWACESPSEDGDMESIPTKPDNRRLETIRLDQIALENAIAQLPPGCRTIVVLHDVEGYEHQEISQRLGISEGTSKSQLHDARMKLRRMLVEGTQQPSPRRHKDTRTD
jgi:RNA polymerase sigma-70 factor (ECF subfamily)